MNPATETFFFSTTVNGNGVLSLHYIPNQVDARMPAVNDQSNVLVSAAQLGGDGSPMQGDASIQVLNVFCRGDQPGSGTVYVRLNVLWDSPLNIRLAFVLWP
jgi:hypothetical protein